MGRIYYVPFDEISVTTDSDQDIWELTAGAANKVILHGFELTSAVTTAEAVTLRLVRRTTSGNGATTTEVKADQDDGAITAAVEQLALAPGSLGDILMGWQWEQLGPLVYLPTPETRIVVQESGLIALNLNTALSGTTLMSGHIVWEEI